MKQEKRTWAPGPKIVGAMEGILDPDQRESKSWCKFCWISCLHAAMWNSVLEDISSNRLTQKPSGKQSTQKILLLQDARLVIHSNRFITLPQGFSGSQRLSWSPLTLLLCRAHQKLKGQRPRNLVVYLISSDANCAKASNSANWANSNLSFPATCFIALIWAAEPTLDTEIPTLIAGPDKVAMPWSNLGIYNWSASSIAMEFLFAFIITKQSGISCVTIPTKHFCIFLKRGKKLKSVSKI